MNGGTVLSLSVDLVIAGSRISCIVERGSPEPEADSESVSLPSSSRSDSRGDNEGVLSHSYVASCDLPRTLPGGNP